MKRFTLFTFLYLALGVCLSAIALGYPTQTCLRVFQQACSSVQEPPTLFVSSAPSHFGARRRSASIADGIQR